MYMWHREDPIRIYPRNRNNIEHTSTYKKVEKLFKKAEFDYSVSRLLLGLTLRSQTPESVSHFEDLVKIENTYCTTMFYGAQVDLIHEKNKVNLAESLKSQTVHFSWYFLFSLADGVLQVINQYQEKLQDVTSNYQQKIGILEHKIIEKEMEKSYMRW